MLVVARDSSGGGIPPLTTQGPPGPPPDQLAALRDMVRAHRIERQRYRAAAGILAVSAVLQVLAPIVHLFILKGAIDGARGVPISWPQFFGAINASARGWQVWGTLAAHFALAGLSVGIARALAAGRPFASPFLIPSGFLTVVLSYFVLGWLVGVLAGALVFIAGFVAIPSGQSFARRLAARMAAISATPTMPPPLPKPHQWESSDPESSPLRGEGEWKG